ncbi:MAG: PAS domain-containing protein [Pseudomonadota bacterium]
MIDVLRQFLSQLGRIAGALADGYVVIDPQHRVLAVGSQLLAELAKHDRAIRHDARGRKCFELLDLEICTTGCPARQCWAERKAVRVTGARGHLAGSPAEQRFVVTAVPVFDEAGDCVGALEVLRDVTEETLLRAKYEDLVAAQEKEDSPVRRELCSRTRDLFEANRRVLELQQEIARLRRGFF